jgi:release factor glutamine methyltransferase
MDVRTALKEAMGRLREARVPSHTLAAELLLMHVLGCERAWLYAHPEEIVEPARAEQYFDLIARRIAGVPTQYLTGRQEFWGLEFEVTPDVLIPRPETEHVVEVALERLGQNATRRRLRIADVGTGSGCLAVALARELRPSAVFATDISVAALGVARRNAARHGVSSCIHFAAGNLLDAFLAPSLAAPLAFDLIVSNPPYVGGREAEFLPREVGEHEPGEALLAGEQGFDFYGPLIGQAARLLGSSGTLVLELGYNVLEVVRALLDAPPWTRLSVTNDLAGIPRIAAAQRM